MKRKRICFIVPCPTGIMPSQRFRFEQYLDLLRTRNFKVTLLPFFNQRDYESIQSKNIMVQAFVLGKGFFRRVLHLFSLLYADYAFIHREAAPVGPPVFEWIASKVLRKKIIYDFDDAIWLTDNVRESLFEKLTRSREKVARICAWSYRVSCGNEFLAKYASRYCNNVVINPTTIDTIKSHNPALYNKPASEKTIIGWTGSRTTLKYLKGVITGLQRLEAKYPNVCFLIIADQRPELALNSVIFKKWSKETEVSDLILADIGIMPLPDDEWAKGKCGFKALQYMALEIPAVVSPVGVNTKIVENGIHGYWCSTEDEWLSKLEKLVIDKNLRQKMGENGRQKVMRFYSVEFNSSTFLSLFA